MVQASSFLLLLAFSAVMIQGAPLAARSKEHHTKDKLPTEESKLAVGDASAGSPQRGGFGFDTPILAFRQQNPPLTTGDSQAASSGSPATLPSCMDPQNPQPASQRQGITQGSTDGQETVVAQGLADAPISREHEERMLEPPTSPYSS
ncbi:hypothetical protein BCR42DRAFT_472262 [Absidia repens]|uniref:Uncharacterized protein n=1 Tax=Absidia repens TaxID=90262 RepID=A0A1X2I1Q4_9FUNG|nr:hypothetical protein BCR42DRAFT_472262 [Absidia repens]